MPSSQCARVAASSEPWSDDLLSDLLERAAQGTLIYDAEPDRWTVSPWLADRLGIGLSGTGLLPLLHRISPIDDARRLRRAVSRCLARGRLSCRHDLRLLCRGRPLWHRAALSVWYGSEGRVARIGAVVSDIDEEMQRNLALQASEARLRGFFDHAPISMFLKDLEGRYVHINRVAEQLFRVPEPSVRGRDVRAFFPPDLAAAASADDDHVLETGCVVLQERLTPVGHDQVWFVNAKFPVRDDHGHTIGIGGLDVDINERKRLEQALRESSALLRAVIDSVPATIGVRDLLGRFVLVNAALAELIGLPPSQCVGRTAIDLTGTDAKRRLPGLHMPRRQEAPDSGFVEMSTQSADGPERIWLANSIIVPDGQGHIVGIGIDITARKQAEVELRTAKETAERANRAKSQFLAAASHDLRQPLQALELFVGALARRVRGGAARALIADIRDCLDSVQRLLGALLDISQLEAGTIQPRIATVPARQVLERVEKEFRSAAAAKGLALTVVPSRQAVLTDPVLLELMVGNLVSNAIRYTRTGGVLVGCRRARGALRVEVHDTGIGIEPSQLDRIFEDFYQVDNSARDRSRGLGLGLAIVRRLASLLGHPIGVGSRPGRGSRFWVELPLGDGILPTEPAAARPRRARSLDGTTALVLEDDHMVARALRIVLENWGMRVVEALSVEEALAAVEGGKPADFIVADYRLPQNRTGVAAVAEIRRRLGSAVPAVVLSGDIAPESLQDMRHSGCHPLAKPVQPAKLRALLTGLLGRAEGSAPV